MGLNSSTAPDLTGTPAWPPFSLWPLSSPSQNSCAPWEPCREGDVGPGRARHVEHSRSSSLSRVAAGAVKSSWSMRRAEPHQHWDCQRHLQTQVHSLPPVKNRGCLCVCVLPSQLRSYGWRRKRRWREDRNPDFHLENENAKPEILYRRYNSCLTGG